VGVTVRKLILSMLTTAALVAAVGTPAAMAAPVKECGNKAAGGRWTYGQIDGAGTFNLTARAVSCATARRFHDRLYRSGVYGRSFRYQGYSCRDLAYGAWEYTDVRCVAGARVIRWQGGA
jgi:hypothetical protein